MVITEFQEYPWFKCVFLLVKHKPTLKLFITWFYIIVLRYLLTCFLFFILTFFIIIFTILRSIQSPSINVICLN